MNSEKTKHQPVMLGREKDFVCFYLEAQSGKIEKRETWEQWAPGAQDIHDKQTKIGIDLSEILPKNCQKIGNYPSARGPASAKYSIRGTSTVLFEKKLVEVLI